MVLLSLPSAFSMPVSSNTKKVLTLGFIMLILLILMKLLLNSHSVQQQAVGSVEEVTSLNGNSIVVEELLEAVSPHQLGKDFQSLQKRNILPQYPFHISPSIGSSLSQFSKIT
jgi:hypothetical protein